MARSAAASAAAAPASPEIWPKTPVFGRPKIVKNLTFLIRAAKSIHIQCFWAAWNTPKSTTNFGFLPTENRQKLVFWLSDLTFKPGIGTGIYPGEYPARGIAGGDPGGTPRVPRDYPRRYRRGYPSHRPSPAPSEHAFIHRGVPQGFTRGIPQGMHWRHSRPSTKNLGFRPTENGQKLFFLAIRPNF